jgi:hypothetical protein
MHANKPQKQLTHKSGVCSNQQTNEERDIMNSTEARLGLVGRKDMWTFVCRKYAKMSSQLTCPSAGPNGGAGFAIPAPIRHLITPERTCIGTFSITENFHTSRFDGAQKEGGKPSARRKATQG